MACSPRHKSLRAAWLAMLTLNVAAWAGVPAVAADAAWIRWLPGSLPAGGYMTLRNDSDRTQTLTAVTSPDYGVLTLHHTRMQGQVSRMEPVAQLDLPPHQTLSFAAQGYHIMLERAARPLRPGDHVTITLHFADGSTLAVPF